MGSGDSWVRRTQASGSLLIEVGNAERDVFFFDVGAGPSNFSSLDVPVTESSRRMMANPASFKRPYRYPVDLALSIRLRILVATT